MSIEVAAYSWVPPFAQGYVRDLRVRRALEEAGLPYEAVGKGREVVWAASEFEGFRHGYAGTIYKGQGKTLDHTYLYHSHHWRQASSYVALTRQRESAHIFAATETARDVRQLARQMSRGEVRSASVAWAVREELPPELRPATSGDGAVREGRGEGPVRSEPPRVSRPGAPSSPRGSPGPDTPEHGWLIAPRPPARRSIGARWLGSWPPIPRCGASGRRWSATSPEPTEIRARRRPGWRSW